MHAVWSVVVLAALIVSGAIAVAHRDERRADRIGVAALALATRAMIAIGVSVALAVTDRAALFPDETVFLSEAAGVARGGPLTGHGYSNLLGVLFKLTGPSAWLPRAINVVAGAALAVIVYEIARLLLWRRAALVAGVATALWPSLVVWSAVALKDTLTVLGLIAILYGALWAMRGRWAGWVVGVVGALLAELLRPYGYAVAGAALLVGTLMWLARTRGRRAVPALALVAAVGFVGLAGGWGFLGLGFVSSQANPYRIVAIRTQTSYGNTAFADRPVAGEGGVPSEYPPFTTREVTKGLVPGVVYGFLGPYPWDVGSRAARALLIVEIPMWLAALALAARGLWRLRWRGILEWLLPLTYAGGLTVIQILYEGNAGTAFRQRSMLIPVVLALAAAGMVARESHDPPLRQWGLRGRRSKRDLSADPVRAPRMWDPLP